MNEEVITYLPEVFYNYGKNEEAWHWLKENLKRFYSNVPDERKLATYPEIAITNISNVVIHMMGFVPDVADNKLATFSRLTNALSFIQANNIPFGQIAMNVEDYRRDIRNMVNLRHDGTTTSILTNSRTSVDTLTWKAQFEGHYNYLYVDGKRIDAIRHSKNGVLTTWIESAVKPGETRKVSVAEVHS